LRWPGATRRRSQARLAERAGLSRSAVTRLELDEVEARHDTLLAIERALTRGGGRFLAATEDGGEGVRLRPAGRSSRSCGSSSFQRDLRAAARPRSAAKWPLQATRRSSTPSGRSRTRGTPGFPWCREWGDDLREIICRLLLDKISRRTIKTS